jgi:N-acetylglucosamine transport system permease protein
MTTLDDAATPPTGTGTPTGTPEPTTGPAGNAARSGDRSLRRDLGVANAFSHGFLLLWALLTTLPLIWVVIGSVRSDAEILADPWGLPGALRFDNWARAWTHAHIGQYFLNSTVVVTGSLALTMLFGATAAYVFARYEFPGRQVVYYLFVGGMMFPVFLALVPLFFVVRNAGLLNTWTGLILVYAAYSLPFTIFFLTAFFRTLPTSVAEAGLLDGCGHFGLFFRVMLPMARPGLISVGIFNFLSQWNQFILPQVLNQGDESDYVLAQGLSALAVSQGYEGDYSGLFAGLTLAMLPVLGVYLIFQRQIQAGLTAGLLK